MKSLAFGMSYWKKYLPGAIALQLLSFIGIICDLFIPLISALIIDYVIMDNPVSEKSGGMFHFLLSGKYGEVGSFQLFWWIAGSVLVLVFIRIVLLYFKSNMQQHLGLKMETDLRVDTYRKLNTLDSATISDYNSGELLQIISGDTIMFKELFCSRIPSILDSIFLLVITVAILAAQNIRFIFIPLITMPFLVITLLRFRVKARDNFRNIRECQSNMNLTVTENIEAVRLVRSFTNEELEMDKFRKSNDSFKASQIKQIKLSAAFDIIFNVIRQLTYIGTIGIGAYLAIKGDIQIGFISASSVYILKIMTHITQINNTLFQMQQQLISGRKMADFINKETGIPDDGRINEVPEKPSVCISGAALRFGEKTIYQDISLDIPYGKKVGIVGATGSGKSMLLKSLVRIHDITDGSITINGADIKDYSLAALRNIYSFVFQDVFLFSNTIDNNIAYGKTDATEEEVQEAARIAQADDFIASFKDGYETIVGEKGLGLSGGQKQRISIARALVKAAPIIVLDDSTSALDIKTEKKLLKDIDKAASEKTLIITAHRLSSVRDCDEIIYLKDNKIVERGTFDELMAKNGIFAKIYNLQESSNDDSIIRAFTMQEE